ncbi:outer membrane receptor protein involved in Fe transport [Luteimonas cucumeris]|uniref:Outer membrane receptor protein involved in Fe transport n=1 Tax=Luteimonas cucumeris TaxID=985012 RepID=A0A562L0D4_9GAMM|nr:TonB-dependent receptor [Luteimonas cucumeris]TWI01092.1 outer membrane receptor protein involved in Fe transport [Luteimonas cucumeris]
MKKNLLALGLLQAIAATTLAATPTQSHAQDAVATTNTAVTTEMERMVVNGQIVYRNRTDDIAPVLSYDLEFFQRFEPRTVGDMLKRVPSVAFLSDVLEYDGARLRGLDASYTQILINGKKVPGGGEDRSFYVDRIPAEVVERIEIVRSPSANRSGDAVAGAINIVLRDAYEFDGGYVRLGASRFDDGEVKPAAAVVASGDLGGGRLLGGISRQGRYNPKQKLSLRYDAPGGEFQDREEQSDTRDGDDTSANLSWVREFDGAKLALSGLYVRTDRTETEHSLEFNDPVSSARENLLSINDQVEDIRQDNFALKAELDVDMAGGRTRIDGSFSRYDDDTVSTEQETGFDDDDTPPSWDGFEGVRTLTALRDDEVAFTLAHQRDVGAAKLDFGVDYTGKDRDLALRVSEVEAEEEGELLPPYEDFDLTASTIEERRIDPYLMLTGQSGNLEWETGLRYETTRSDIRVDGEQWDNDYSALLPSAHLRWNVTDADRLSLSLARTVRRPDFNYLAPVFLEGEYGDNDFIGNPLLEQENAWGVDLGFEHRLGRQGVVGVNVFYRDVKDLIELVNHGEPSATALEDFEDEVEDFLEDNPDATPDTPGYPVLEADSFVYSAANVGDGKVYGVELDLSTPLTAFGMPDTGVFLNYSWLDSKVDDGLGERRFNNQARYVLNVGFIQDLESINSSFGISYRRQGGAESRVIGEEVETTYGADLEAFVEKRFGESWSVRLTGNNLLDAKKQETFHKFNTRLDQIERSYDEFELESEQSGRVYQLVVRYAF